MANIRPGGPTGGGDGGDGGVLGGTGSSGVPVNLSAIPISGGLSGTWGVLMFPLWDITSSSMTFEALDLNNFNTEQPGIYAFRVEDFTEGTTVTINRIRIKYRNLGPCKFALTLQGMYSFITKLMQIGPGTKNGQNRAIPNQADGRLYIAYCDLVFTDESPQLIISREANAGPLDIVSITLMGSQHQPQKGV